MDDLEAIRQTCRLGVDIYKHWSKHTKSLLMNLLNAASKHKIPVDVWLRQTYGGIDAASGGLILQSGLILPRVTSAELIHIDTEPGQSISQDEMMGIMTYAAHSERLKELRFHLCELPPMIPLGNALSLFKKRGVKVTWRNSGHRLNHQSGQWEIDDMEAIRKSCGLGVVIYKQWSKTTHNLQRKLLEAASKTNVPVLFISLRGCFNTVDTNSGSIVLTSGVHLPRISSNKKLTINKHRREMTETELLGIMGYAKDIQELKFSRCFLPYSVTEARLPRTITSRSMKVLWVPKLGGNHIYELDPLSAKWASTRNQQALTQQEYSNMLRRFRKEWGSEEKPPENSAAGSPATVMSEPQPETLMTRLMSTLRRIRRRRNSSTPCPHADD